MPPKGRVPFSTNDPRNSRANRVKFRPHAGSPNRGQRLQELGAPRPRAAPQGSGVPGAQWSRQDQSVGVDLLSRVIPECAGRPRCRSGPIRRAGLPCGPGFRAGHPGHPSRSGLPDRGPAEAGGDRRRRGRPGEPIVGRLVGGGVSARGCQPGVGRRGRAAAVSRSDAGSGRCGLPPGPPPISGGAGAAECGPPAGGARDRRRLRSGAGAVRLGRGGCALDVVPTVRPGLGGRV